MLGHRPRRQRGRRLLLLRRRGAGGGGGGGGSGGGERGRASTHTVLRRHLAPHVARVRRVSRCELLVCIGAPEADTRGLVGVRVGVGVIASVWYGVWLGLGAGVSLGRVGAGVGLGPGAGLGVGVERVSSRTPQTSPVSLVSPDLETELARERGGRTVSGRRSRERAGPKDER